MREEEETGSRLKSDTVGVCQKCRLDLLRREMQVHAAGLLYHQDCYIAMRFRQDGKRPKLRGTGHRNIWVPFEEPSG